jgi:hypothetical protein
MKKKSKRRQGDEGKPEDQEKREPSQEDESDKPHDLEFIHPTSQPKLKNFLEVIFHKCLTLPKNLENPSIFKLLDLANLSIHIKSTLCHHLLSNYH